MNKRRSNVPGAHPPLEFLDATHVRIGRRTSVYFAGSNYLGLAHHSKVHDRMRLALASGMTQPGASRATTGDHVIYSKTERALAQFFRQPAAALVTSGYLAPWAAVHALRSHSTHLLIHQNAHACVQDAALLSGLPCLRFDAEDLQGLSVRLKSLGRSARPLIATDGTYGTRGGIAPLRELLAMLPQRGWLLVDDAHGAGAVGPGGRGALAACGVEDSRVVLTVSLAKALGVGGGAVLGDRRLMESLRQQSAAFVGSTSMPLVIPAGVCGALSVLRSEPERLRRLQANMKRLHRALPKGPEIVGDPRTPVTGIYPSSSRRKSALVSALQNQDIYPSFISYLGGPSEGFFRLAVSSEHSDQEIDELAGAVTSVLG